MTPLRIRSFDFLRAACALMVMAGHLYTEMGLQQNRLIFGLTSFGTEAVIGFFVLSGCLISMQDYGNTANYLRARFVRIMPNYYAMLIFTVVAMLILGMKFDITNVVANAFFLQTLYVESFKPLNWYAQSWSLSYEIWYYIVFIFVLAKPRLLIPLFAASVAAGLLIYALPKPPDVIDALLRAFSFLAMWLCGVIVTRLVQQGRGVSMATGAFMMAIGFCMSRVPFEDPAKFDFGLLFNFGVGFAFLVWALVTQVMPKPSHVLHFNFVVRGALSAMALAMLWIWSDSFFAMKLVMTVEVVVFAVLPELMVRVIGMVVKPTLRFMYYVGGLSYALYLVHYPLLHVFYFTHPFPPLGNILCVIVLSFPLAHLLDYIVQPRIAAAVRGKKNA